MKRTIVHIDEDLCNGCGECVPNCHEGALQIIDGKARLISDLMCDGLGACIGHCPVGAIAMEEREAQPYDEIAVMKEMVTKGKNTVIAHLKHLKDHNETEFLKQGVGYLKENEEELEFELHEVTSAVHGHNANHAHEHQAHNHHQHQHGGCPGSQSRSFGAQPTFTVAGGEQPSALSHWPVQMHLINPASAHFRESDFVLAADCVAFTLGSFHGKFLAGKTLGIACPKLDHGTEIYIEKITSLIDDARINTLTIMIMEVPCCGGLVQIAQLSLQQSKRKIPVKVVKIGIQGEVLLNEWI